MRALFHVLLLHTLSPNQSSIRQIILNDFLLFSVHSSHPSMTRIPFQRCWLRPRDVSHVPCLNVVFGCRWSHVSSFGGWCSRGALALHRTTVAARTGLMPHCHCHSNEFLGYIHGEDQREGVGKGFCGWGTVQDWLRVGINTCKIPLIPVKKGRFYRPAVYKYVQSYIVHTKGLPNWIYSSKSLWETGQWKWASSFFPVVVQLIVCTRLGDIRRSERFALKPWDYWSFLCFSALWCFFISMCQRD